MSAKLTVAALALALSASVSAYAQSGVSFDKLHEGAQSSGVCIAPLNAAAEDKVGLIAAKAATPTWGVGDVLTRENDVRGAARVQAYSLGCKAVPVVAAVKYYDDNAK
ncbi:hypothetical protein ACFSM5_20900 [Lacibacterium aquatile]|uniref:DUF732 domain-containing protein n=1 Tax=Lacibacterium aquatile TaxID=1168082 RepID=A0ABW5E1M5_9PROT